MTGQTAFEPRSGQPGARRTASSSSARRCSLSAGRWRRSQRPGCPARRRRRRLRRLHLALRPPGVQSRPRGGPLARSLRLDVFAWWEPECRLLSPTLRRHRPRSLGAGSRTVATWLPCTGGTHSVARSTFMELAGGSRVSTTSRTRTSARRGRRRPSTAGYVLCAGRGARSRRPDLRTARWRSPGPPARVRVTLHGCRTASLDRVSCVQKSRRNQKSVRGCVGSGTCACVPGCRGGDPSGGGPGPARPGGHAAGL